MLWSAIELFLFPGHRDPLYEVDRGCWTSTPLSVLFGTRRACIPLLYSKFEGCNHILKKYCGIFNDKQGGLLARGYPELVFNDGSEASHRIQFFCCKTSLLYRIYTHIKLTSKRTVAVSVAGQLPVPATPYPRVPVGSDTVPAGTRGYTYWYPRDH